MKQAQTYDPISKFSLERHHEVTIPDAQGFERTFYAEQAVTAVSKLGFINPREGIVPTAAKSGTIYLKYLDPVGGFEQKRTFYIYNKRLIQDPTYPEITYEPTTLID